MSETEKRKRVPSEASKKAALVRAYYAALEKHQKAVGAMDLVEERVRAAHILVEKARNDLASVNIEITAPE